MENNGESTEKLVWFEEDQIFIDHMHVVSVDMIRVLGTWLSITR